MPVFALRVTPGEVIAAQFRFAGRWLSSLFPFGGGLGGCSGDKSLQNELRLDRSRKIP